ncbi:calcium-binding protein [Variovorax soli]|uniref:Ca2+-binding RTX toxin-like protein n=1 Tax=Variovorax soli TaxID=376815 RepID=A0ABU1NN84_9BURK|nr:calcium-binding protein [Variovorax soli]MDR6539341.1 Ca2+-binding RTX toxin-like protein [Variovorax soli]
MPRWGWAGTWGDWIWSPIGLGEDYVSIDGKSVRDYAENWGKSLGAQGDGFSRWLQQRLDGAQDLGGDPFTGMPWPGVDRLVDQFFDTARAWRQPVDPLMLDLDGDGLELKRADGSILFDHNADTIKTGTGWIGADDGILVRDLDGNGSIDSGRELFGIDTLKRDGKSAANGFDALADLDSNADGQFTAADLAWNSVQVWRDLDQDGVSDAGELFGLDALGIRRIGVTGSATNATGGTQAGTTVNGSLIAQSASFTRDIDGVQVDRTVGAVDLESNPFYREFTVAVPLTEQAKALPQMQGSGRARDLDEAVSLSPALATQLSAFSQASTRDAQRAQLDGLIAEWAQSSDFWQSLETTLDGNVKISGLPAGMTEAQYRNLVGVLEVFNGERFYNSGAGGTTLTAGTTKTTTTDTATQITRAGYGIAPPAAQLALLQQSYDALKESIYSALVLQTRLKPYLDAIELTIDDSGIHFDTTALTALLDQKKAASERDAIIDLVELDRFALPTLDAVGFAGLDQLRGWVEALPAGSGLRTELASLNVYTGTTTGGTAKSDIYLGDANGNSFSGGAGDDAMTGAAGNDTLDGGADNDTLNGGEGADTLLGQSGADVLAGGAGNDSLYGGGYYGGGGATGDNDTLDGGAGNDYLMGGFGSDTYLFGRGDGQDTINNDSDSWNGYADQDANKQDVLRFKEGVLANDVSTSRNGDNLVLKINGTTDQVTIQNYFNGDGISARGWVMNQIQFADGTTWTLADIKTQVLTGGTGNDTIYGYSTADTLSGDSGNDGLYGRDGNDVLNAGAGDDSLAGEGGNDTLNGEAGNDTLQGGAGDDILQGGAGNDILAGGRYDTWNGYYDGWGNDVYQFGRGDGQDRILDKDTSVGNLDKIVFKPGISEADVQTVRVGDHLLLKVAGTSDQIQIDNYFAGDATAGWAIEEIRFSDAPEVVWNVDTVKAKALNGGAGNDTITGYATADTLNGGDGNDVLYGRDGSDVLNAGSGDDGLAGEAGNDTLNGEGGNDTLQGGAGDDVLHGGAGNDILAGGRYDTWNGYYDGWGNDVYQFGRGDGQDRILDKDTTIGNLDRIVFKPGIAEADVQTVRVGDHLLLKVAGTSDQIQIDNYFAGDATAGWAIEEIRFSDAPEVVWSVDTVKAKALNGSAGNDTLTGYATADTLNGNDGNDVLYGRDGNDTLNAGAGDDSLAGEGGSDMLNGEAGNDTLQGGAGDDVLQGGAGNDILAGGRYDTWNGYYDGWGNDVYQFGRGDGQDRILDKDTSVGNLDKIVFKPGIAEADVQAVRVGDHLLLKLAGTSDQIQIDNFFGSDATSGWTVEEIRFSDAPEVVWNVDAVKVKALNGGAGNDTITGYATADTLNGNDGNDVLYGRDGNDTLNAGAGDDSLAGEGGSDTLNGEAGNDTLQGGAGDDILQGGAGNDILAGGRYDTWNGYYDGWGNDVYQFGRGDGQDRILDKDTSVGNLDKIVFKPGISEADVQTVRVGDHLLLKVAGTSDQIQIDNYFAGDATAGWAIEEIRFSDAPEVVWNVDTVKAKALNGGAGNDTITGYATADTLSGGDGNDVLYGRDGNDTLNAGAGDDSLGGEAGSDMLKGDTGNDTLQGGAGDDILHGGAGNDILAGGRYDTWNGYYDGWGNDTYQFGRGDGQDRIVDVDSTPGNTDVVAFASNVTADQLWFRHVGNDLEVSIIGTDDKLTINNWYSGNADHVEQFQTSDGHLLVEGMVQNLVQAMASFSPPPPGQTTLSPGYQNSLATVLAASWK